jgi:hypothetical protein
MTSPFFTLMAEALEYIYVGRVEPLGMPCGGEQLGQERNLLKG